MQPIKRMITAPKVETFDVMESHAILMHHVNNWLSRQPYDVIYDIAYKVTHRRDNVLVYSCFITYKPQDEAHD